MVDPGAPREQWPSDWLRAVLTLAVLKALEPGRSYGYAITRALANAGVGEVRGGTLYPLLTRLETAGLVQSRWHKGSSGPGRKYFSLTPAGREKLQSQRDQWGEFTSTIATYVEE